MSEARAEPLHKVNSDRSLNTEATHQGDMSPSPMQVRRNSRRNILQRMKKRPSQRQSQLFMPDIESKPVEDPKESIWTTKFMKAVYISAAGSYLFNTHYFLYGIPLFLLVEIGLILLKWTNFFGDDPYVRSALKGWGKHHKIAMKELERTTNGGFLRRRQEVIMAGVGYQSSFQVRSYFEHQSHEIGVRARDDFKTRIAQYNHRKASKA
eukprot:CAMPEP_0119015590 /NCGR_PEP_ID=MMETSP1176-20130426/11272_1 /TAXON_ID=265551 /ORGANISM="Synedropsis recta cf, Strain CCMP1620" /LENGTH=208 /DNA_ID=CAMNT_0006968897 /DNA_START=85 /DNA_END=711 /DNA_ORIENTATION=+